MRRRTMIIIIIVMVSLLITTTLSTYVNSGQSKVYRNRNRLTTSVQDRRGPEKRSLVERYGELQFFVIFVTVTGIPLLLTLAALLLTDSTTHSVRVTNKKTWVEDVGDSGERTMEGPKLHHSPFLRKGDKPSSTKVKESIASLALTKEVIRVASQSLNLAANTVDLYNILRGAGSIGGPPDGGGGGDSFKGKNNSSAAALGKLDSLEDPLVSGRSQAMRLVSKLIHLATTSIYFMLQILNY